MISIEKSIMKRIFLTFVFMLTLVSFNTTLLTMNSTSYVNTVDNLKSSLQTSEVGENVNVTLHQSYVNNTIIELNNLSHSNKFNVPCPTEPTFNSSYTEFLVGDIIAPNKTLYIEDSIIGFLALEPWFYTSFQVLDDCILKTVKVNIRSTADGRIFYFDVFNSMLNNSYITPDQDLTGGMYFLKEIYNDSTTNIWLNITGLNQELDVDATYNNTFFICLWPSGTGTRWYYETEADGKDDTISWANGPYPESGLDFTLIVEVAPLDNTPKPSDIGLEMNNAYITDNIDNSGSWASTEEYTDPSGHLEFELSADWWDVACDITKTQINYTKTDLKASTNYETPEPDLIFWNASIDESINSYDARINEYNYIQLTIPINWSDIKAFNGSIEKPVILSGNVINGYRSVLILDAGNGVNWHLTAIIDSRTPGNGGGTISFGNYFLVLTIVVIIPLIYFKKRRSYRGLST